MIARGKHISTVSAGVVAPAGATLWNVNINTAVAGAVLTIYDAGSATNPLAVIDASAVGSLWYVIYCAKGIYYDLSVGAADVTIGFE